MLMEPLVNLSIKIPIRYAHAADPEYSLRASSIRQLIKRRHFVDPTLSRYPGWVPTPNPTPRDPPPPHPHPPTHPPHPTPSTPRAPGGGQGTQGRLRRPWGGNGAHGTLRGHSVAIPNGKPFRMEGDSEWMADYRLAGPLKECEISVLQVAF